MAVFSVETQVRSDVGELVYVWLTPLLVGDDKPMEGAWWAFVVAAGRYGSADRYPIGEQYDPRA